MRDGTLTTASSEASGGDITITSRDKLHLISSTLTTSVRGGFGGGGDILIDPSFIILNHSDIIANAYAGDGGNLLLICDYLFADSASRMEASSELGLDGTIEIDTPNLDLSESFIVLPGYRRIPEVLQDDCEASSRDTSSSLVVTGSGGLPPQP